MKIKEYYQNVKIEQNFCIGDIVCVKYDTYFSNEYIGIITNNLKEITYFLHKVNGKWLHINGSWDTIQNLKSLNAEINQVSEISIKV